jgi:outer membrane protein OmpA-like peptidoglycan-associated protein
MRRLFFAAPALFALVGCGTATTSYVHSDTTLGRVVVYRNGIAYFERYARVEGDSLQLKVPTDKVDDFLKSLTVVDAKTGEPAPIAYPTTANDVPGEKDPTDPGLVKMNIHLNGPSPHELKLSYVTDAPSWKPSYRIFLGKDNKVSLQASAIVDNTSGEDWKNVQLGVGSSSALSFRFDLRSVRMVSRETLQADTLFAQAPPMGGPAFANAPQQQGIANNGRMVANFNDDVLATADIEQEKDFKSKKAAVGNKKPAEPGRVAGAHRGAPDAPAAASRATAKADAFGGYPAPQAPPSQLDQVASALKQSQNQIVIQGYADSRDGDKNSASLERANRAREQLIRRGVDPSRVVAMGNGIAPGHTAGVSIEEKPLAAPQQQAVVTKAGEGQDEGKAAGGKSDEPIGTSHFESKAHMTVPRGTSALVSILSSDTDGEVVYFYDAESARGNSDFPFRAVRLRNPTDSVLESGPVTVFGEGKFIGEGMSEPIPARSNAFIPFALDRQISVEKKDDESDKIAKIITVQRGVFHTEVQHSKKRTFVLHNRSTERATVYLRHTVEAGYKLLNPPKDLEKLGAANLFKITLEPNQKGEVTIEEATPLFKTTDVRTQDGMNLVVAYLSAEAEGKLKAQVTELLKLQKEMANTEQQIGTTRDQMGEYRARMDELHAQVVTLKLVKTAGPLMQNLEKKLSEVSDKLSKATIDLVALQEKLMVARIKFQDGVADLSLATEDKSKG